MSRPESSCESGSGSLPLAVWYTAVPSMAGVGRHFVDVARTAIAGVEVLFVVPEGALAEALRDAGARVCVAHVGVEDGARTALRNLRRILARSQPAILHTHLAFSDFVGAAAVATLPRSSRPVMVSTEHGIAADARLYNASPLVARLKTGMHRARIARTSRVIAVSESTASQVRAHWGPRAPLSVIRNGVDRAGDVQREVGMKFLSLSRLAPEKNISDALRAFARVAATYPGAEFTIAGEGPQRAQLEGLAESLGLAHRVRFPGYLDADEALAQHQVVVQLSRWENLSYTLLDAVARGLGVVATDVGGNSEIVGAASLVDASDHARVAQVMVEQATSIEQRSDLPPSIPSLAHMCSAISDTYKEVLR